MRFSLETETLTLCSTPSGVIVRDTSSRRPSAPRAISAQRLPASSSGTPPRRPAACADCSRAQRLPASSSGTHGRLLGAVALLVVLNAFRRHRQGHVDRVNATPFPPWCSTPSGVIVRDTGGGSRSCRACRCAQRLPASSSGTRRSPTRTRMARKSAQRLPASSSGTPVVPGHDECRREVLNAFRRHRQGHSAAGPGWAAGDCAQRLPASSSGTLDGPGHGVDGPEVLNAFRRHRQGHHGTPRSIALRDGCSTPSGVIVRDTTARSSRAPGVRVLNAFRRHRQGHIRKSSTGIILIRCSTPSGVIVRDTSPRPRPSTSSSCAQRLPASSSGTPDRRLVDRLRHLVLNAFRRHRQGHREPLPVAAKIEGCSAPSGVIVRDTAFVPPLDRDECVLNAFRRHRQGHIATDLPMSRMKCAQRLPASSSGTRGGDRCRERAAVCSTPSGVIVRDTQAAVMGVANLKLCSTPSGVIVRDTRTAGPTWSHPPCAQRLPASSSGTPSPGCPGRTTRTLCSTPSGVIVRDTPNFWSPSVTRSKCSTPSGVIVRDTGAAIAAPPGLIGCSTPSGVIVRDTRSSRSSTRPTRSAQRLPASSSGTRDLTGRSSGPVAGRAQRLPASSSGTRPGSGRPGRTSRVLNAFRRHRQGHPSSPRATCPRPRVLNAFRRHRQGHTSTGRAGRPDASVLNAFRRHRQGHEAREGVRVALVECSTPSGVIVRDTRAGNSPPRRRPCAQRLPASSSGTQRPHAAIVAGIKCSTPSGVIVRDTRPGLPVDPPVRAVLNAFRRHRQGHGERSPVPQPRTRAQRLPASSSGTLPRRDRRQRRLGVLNAFRRHRQGHGCRCRAGPRPAPCAQRLPASSSGTPSRSPGPPSSRSVLNAFRRHRQGHRGRVGPARVQGECSTPSGVIVRDTSRRPTSSRRSWCAQRLPASSSGTRGDRRSPVDQEPCSTPSGVIVRDTRTGPCTARRRSGVLNAFRRHRQGHVVGRGPPRGLRRVLNAFRRHRQGHGSRRGDDLVAVECSTPSGVIVRDTRGPPAQPAPIRRVLNAFRRHRQGHSAAGMPYLIGRSAQRLPASSSGTLRKLRRTRRPPPVLNAFRRHRQGHSATQQTKAAAPIRAQRLPASSSGTRHPRAGERPAVRVLNAFRRHRQGHLAHGRDDRVGPVCSTPSGVIVRDTHFSGGGASS